MDESFGIYLFSFSSVALSAKQTANPGLEAMKFLIVIFFLLKKVKENKIKSGIKRQIEEINWKVRKKKSGKSHGLPMIC